MGDLLDLVGFILALPFLFLAGGVLAWAVAVYFALCLGTIALVLDGVITGARWCLARARKQEEAPDAEV